MNNLEKTSEILEPKRDEKGRLLPNQTSLNPDGRPKGSISILTDLKAKLEKIKRERPEEYEQLLDDYWQDKGKRELLIKMIDGMPRQQTDVTSNGQTIIPILGGLTKEEKTE